MKLLSLVLGLMVGCFSSGVAVNYSVGVPKQARPGRPAVEVTKLSETYGVKSRTPQKEIIYVGHDGTTIFLVYREYTSEGLVKDAFKLEAVFDLSDSKTVVFGPWILEVESATNETFSFTVTGDEGLALQAAKGKPRPAK